MKSQDIVINEVSQCISGAGNGTREYVELVIAGTTSCGDNACLDLRGWYLDDNNGFFGTEGIASGCIRFTQDPQWECIQIGTLILIYNDDDFDASLIPVNDETDANDDLVYVLPVGSNYFEGNNANPSTLSSVYPTTGFTSGSGTWNSLGMKNAGDSFQVLDPADLLNPVISVSWGSNTIGTGIYFAGSSGGKAMAFTNSTSDNYFDQLNWVQLSASIAGNQTPGLPNTPENDSWISSMLTFAPPVADAGSDPVLPCNFTPVQLDASASTVNIQSYAWSGPGIVSGANTVDPYINAVGVYTVTVTDMNGCTHDTSVTVTLGAGFNIDLGNDTLICSGSTITLDAGVSSATYAWSPAGTDQTLVASAVGTYSVTVTDGACSGIGTINISIGTLPTVDLGEDDSICDGASIDLNAGNPGSNYIWGPNGETTQIISLSILGTYSVTVTNGYGCTGQDDFILGIIPLPVVDLGPDQATCVGDTLTLDAGVGPDTYLWSVGNQISQTIKVDTAGLYFVTVTIGACSAYDSVTIVFNALPILDLDDTLNYCTGTTGTLDAGNGFDSYLWTGGTSTQILNVDTSGTYHITVGLTNCYTSDSIVVNFVTDPSISLGADTSLCIGDSLLLDAGNGFETYTWSTSGSGQTIYVSTPATYSVTVSVGGGLCTATDAIIVSNQPAIGLELGDDFNVCEGYPYTLDAGNAATYLWSSDNADSQTIDRDTSGFFSVTVTDAFGCSEQDNITVTVVPLPVVNLGTDTNLCPGNTVVLDAQNVGSTYAWLPTGESSITINVISSGIYSVTVTSSDNCEGSDDIIVNFYDGITVTGSTIPICDGVNTALDAGSGAASYLWSNAATVQIINVSAEGNYSVTVTSSDGCTDSDVFQVIAISTPVVDLGNDVTECAGIPVFLDAGNSGMTYLWSPGNDTTQLLSISSSGTYSVTVNNSGCTASDSATVTFKPLPTIIASNDTSIKEGESVQIFANGSPSYTYLWSPPDGLNDVNIYDPIATPEETTSYSVLVTDGNCSVFETVIVVVIPNQITVFNTFTPNGDGANDTWYIKNIDKFDGNYVHIYNRNGHLIYTAKNYHEHEWDGKFLEVPVPAATYYYMINLGDGEKQVKGFVTVIR